MKHLEGLIDKKEHDIQQIKKLMLKESIGYSI